MPSSCCSVTSTITAPSWPARWTGCPTPSFVALAFRPAGRRSSWSSTSSTWNAGGSSGAFFVRRSSIHGDTWGPTAGGRLLSNSRRRICSPACTPASSESQSHGRVRSRISAREAASTLAWPCSSGRTQRSDDAGSVPAARTTSAFTVSPHFSSGMPMTATSATAAWENSTSSTSIDETFSPPEMITSFLRSEIVRYPSSSSSPPSPVWNQPSSRASAVASGCSQ